MRGEQLEDPGRCGLGERVVEGLDDLHTVLDVLPKYRGLVDATQEA